MANGYYPLLPGGVLEGPEPPNYTGDDFDCDDPSLEEDRRTWETRDKRRIPYNLIEERHLLNIQRSVRAGVGSASAVARACIDAEVLRRGLKALPPYESKEEALAVSHVSALWLLWGRLGIDNEPRMLAIVNLWLAGECIEQFVQEPGVTSVEAECIDALLEHEDYALGCSPAGKMRCAEVFRRWANAMHIADQLDF